jgi:hypothetical protein
MSVPARARRPTITVDAKTWVVALIRCSNMASQAFSALTNVLKGDPLT